MWGRLSLMPASITLLILIWLGLVFALFFLFFFVRIPDEHHKIKKARTGCGKTGFLILHQAALKRVCSWGMNYRLYLAYGEEIIWCAAN